MTAKFVDYLSPSKIHLINECKLRFILLLIDEKYNASKSFNKNTFLGILMHSILEQYIKRQSSPEDYEELWNELLYQQFVEFGIDIQESDIIKYQLPYYEVKKKKLLNFLLNYNYKIPKFELFLEKKIRGGIVRGTADMIFDNPTEKKVKIIDFKSGPIASYKNAERQEIKTGYLLQLKTYGYVYWLKGYSPENINCALQGISDFEYEEIIFSEEDYNYHENFLTDLKKDINQAINEGKQHYLASPNSTACMNCEFSSSCNPLHESMKDEFNHPTLSLIHHLNTEFNDEENKIIVNNNNVGKVPIIKVPNRPYNSIKKSIKNGKTIFISGLHYVLYTNVKYWTTYTNFNEL